MKFTDGVQNAILADDLPVMSLYDFYILGHRLFVDKAWRGEALTRRPREWDMLRARNAIQRMVDRKLLVADADFRSGVWRVTQSTRGRDGGGGRLYCRSVLLRLPSFRHAEIWADGSQSRGTAPDNAQTRYLEHHADEPGAA